MSKLDVLVVFVACFMMFAPLILTVGEDGDRDFNPVEAYIALAGLLLLIGFFMLRIWFNIH